MRHLGWESRTFWWWLLLIQLNWNLHHAYFTVQLRIIKKLKAVISIKHISKVERLKCSILFRKSIKVNIFCNFGQRTNIEFIAYKVTVKVAVKARSRFLQLTLTSSSLSYAAYEKTINCTFTTNELKHSSPTKTENFQQQTPGQLKLDHTFDKIRGLQL